MSVWFHKFHVSIFQYGSVAAKFQVVYEGAEAVTISIFPPMAIVLILPFFKKVNEVALVGHPPRPHGRGGLFEGVRRGEPCRPSGEGKGHLL